jgi:hypothetical protein
LELLVHLVLLAIQAILVHQERQEAPEIKDLLEQLVQQDLQVLLELKDLVEQ